MFVPGHNEKLMASALRVNADVLLLDIEDSVQPVENKEKARQLIRMTIESGQLKDKIIFPRVNDRESGQLLKDIFELTIPGVTGFMYPKSHSGQDIYFFDKLLETIEYQKGIAIGTYKVIPLIETTGGLVNVDSICKASSRVVAIAFGCEDYVTDLGGIHDHEGLSIYFARSIIAITAKANGVVPIDTVHINVHDLVELEQNLQLSKKLGFEGMLVLHPKELPLVHKYYSPTPEEVNDAKEVLRLFEEAIKEGRGVAIMNGKFIGPPMVANAKNLLRRAELTTPKG
jgi:citrate lyase subunit beta/citryl-CoA lyase